MKESASARRATSRISGVRRPGAFVAMFSRIVPENRAGLWKHHADQAA